MLVWIGQIWIIFIGGGEGCWQKREPVRHTSFDVLTLGRELSALSACTCTCYYSLLLLDPAKSA
jgi:hypothetical protein